MTGMRRGLVRALVVLVGAMAPVSAGAVASPASASGHGGGLTVTYNESDFLAANTIRVTQTFDDPVAFAPERRIVSFQGVRFWSKDPSPPYWTVGGAESATLYRKFSDGADTGDVAVSFGKDGDVRSFGFLLNPFGHPNQIAIRVVEVDGTVTLVLLPQNAGATYFGLHSRIGIEKVVIGQRPDLAGGWTNFSLDRVSRGHIMSGHH